MRERNWSRTNRIYTRLLNIFSHLYLHLIMCEVPVSKALEACQLLWTNEKFSVHRERNVTVLIRISEKEKLPDEQLTELVAPDS